MLGQEIKERFIEPSEIEKDSNIEELSLVKTIVIYSGGAFENFESLKNVYFGLDITRIGNRTFENCKSLTDVWFAITDENKYIEIADDAFRGCDKPITFHIFASALKNKSLNEYAKKHGFRITGMI